MYSQRFPFECWSCAQSVCRVEKSRLLNSLMGFFSKGFHSPGKAGGKKPTFWRVDWIVADLQDVICSRKENEEEMGVFIQSFSVCNQYTLFSITKHCKLLYLSRGQSALRNTLCALRTRASQQCLHLLLAHLALANIKWHFSTV